MFSTTIDCPSVRETPSPSSLAMTSVAAPGPVGTISLMGRLGQLWRSGRDDRFDHDNAEQRAEKRFH